MWMDHLNGHTLPSNKNEMQSFMKTLWGDIEPHQHHLHDPRILAVGNALSDVLKHVPMVVKVPQMITVGSQSSGKSSVINGILSMDLLPTGTDMVTRTPLRLELLETREDVARLEFGSYAKGMWVADTTFVLALPVPAEEEIHKARIHITEVTTQLAGPGANISATEIIMRLYSPLVPNLTIIDCPGLTQVACTDRGQPLDIKDQIIALVTFYIQQPASIILGIMPARTDLEADPSFALIKQFDPRGDRTIGILTKVDLMEKGTHVSDYLLNKISVDLQLHHGYFAVKNRSSAESKISTITKGFTLEQGYFQTHPEYKKNPRILQRCGTRCMAKHLTGILVCELMRILPSLHMELCTLEQSLRSDIQILGAPVPTTPEVQVAHVQTLLVKFSTQVCASLQSRGLSRNTGRVIREALIRFRTEIGTIIPFSKENCTRQYLDTMLDNCEGNHMKCLHPPIEVLEACLVNKETSAFAAFHPYSQHLLAVIKTELLLLSRWVVDTAHLSRFPNLVMYIEEVMERVVNTYATQTSDRLRELVEMEEAYIWTDDPTFHSETKQADMRNMLETYFRIIVGHVQHIVPKAIMHGVVRKIETNLTEHLLTGLDHTKIAYLLTETH
jgi:dynamin 1-like protein